MFRRSICASIAIFFAMTLSAFAAPSTAIDSTTMTPALTTPAPSGDQALEAEPTKTIPKVAVIISDQSRAWNNQFWLDDLSDLLLDRYSYFRSPAQLEVLKNNPRIPLTQEHLSQIAKEKNVDQVVVLVVQRAETITTPNWQFGWRDNYEGGNDYINRVYIEGAIYQVPTGIFVRKTQWDQGSDSSNLGNMVKNNSIRLLDQLDKKAEPLL